MAKGKFLFLGTGASSGIPIIGCKCTVCLSESSFNKRYRPSGLLTLGDKKFLIDAGPDFRDQALRAAITHLTGVLFTHAHYDHIGGIDDLRIFYFIEKSPVKCLASESTLKHLEVRYPYLFEPHVEGKSVTARFDWTLLDNKRGYINFLEEKIHYITYIQGTIEVTGFRFGDLAYIPDIREYDDTIFKDLKGVNTLIVSALRHTPSYMHFTVDQAVDFAQKIEAGNVFLTHISHELDHDETNNYLPDGIQMAYDGLELEFDDGT